jgi:hypothetical protein
MRMRTALVSMALWALGLPLLEGCSKILGLHDPVAAGSGAPDAPLADGPADDAVVDNRPCTPPAGFGAPTLYPLTGTPTMIAVGDFDHDNKQDVAVATGAKLVIYHGDGTGALGRMVELAITADGVIAGDFDDDFHDDLATWVTGSNEVAVRMQDAVTAGTFNPPQVRDGLSGIVHIDSDRLDGGNFAPDLLIQDTAGLSVYTANQIAVGTFSFEIQLAITNHRALQIVDLTDDGRNDVAYVTPEGAIEVAPQVNGVTFGAPAQIGTMAATAAAGFGRLGGDPLYDVVIATAAGGVRYRQTGAGKLDAFTAVDGTIPGVTGPLVRVVDVDGDTRDDLVVADGIVLQTAKGVFAPIAGCPIAATAVFADLSKNGKPEMLRLVGGMLEVRVQ